jgi:hypothetical protein
MLKINKNKQTKKKTIEFGKDADLRISINWTVIRDNDVSGHRFEKRTSIWVYYIYLRNDIG